MKFVAHVTDSSKMTHRVEVEAPDRVQAMRAAVASIPRAKSVSCRAEHATQQVVDDMGVRFSTFPLVGMPSGVTL